MTVAEEADSAERTTAAGAAYVYGVVRAGEIDSIAADGVRGAPVEVVEQDGVAALVSELRDPELRVTRKDLRRHLEVVGEAFQRTTILPCPFGTSLDSRQAVSEEVLRPQSRTLLAGLAELDGTVQMNLKVQHDEEALLRELVATDPAIARLRAETAGQGDETYSQQLELGERVAAAVAAQREADAARMLAVIAPEAVDAVVEDPGSSLVLKAAFLVSRERLERFDSTLERVAESEQGRLLFDVIGPLPPTAFAAHVVGG